MCWGHGVSLKSQSCACSEEAGPWPSALKARGLDSRVLLELLIIPLPDPPNSSFGPVYLAENWKNVWNGQQKVNWLCCASALCRLRH